MKGLNANYQIPDLNKKAFARTNAQTISHRVVLLKELVPDVHAIAEICCGDSMQQYQAYINRLGVSAYHCLDIEPKIVAANKKRGIECHCGDALDEDLLKRFVLDDVLFFGPPLSTDCNGHQILQFADIRPGYCDFARILLAELNYSGMLVCICPNTTTMGDIAKLYHQIQGFREGFNLRLIHHSYSTITGNGEKTEMRLKYIELWFSNQLDDLWEVRENKSL